ncbi:hypothetical protein HYC85_007269 [Camellia sinensis]|uniref:Uncharacterized protein n=1 Tax=Camellia sinensis TaxID=4442 RepID=A0A7J7HNH3_CAMSI|nr:hypothetical protein HYC85_007269 [Camellia sinensis]
MQGNRGGRDPFFNFGDPFAGFGGFGGVADHRNMLSGFFGGRNPFDDPFFTRPIGGMFESSIFGPTGNPFTGAHASGFVEHQVPHQVPQPNRSRGPIIEELNSDEEKEQDEEKKKGNPRKHGRLSNEPYVEDPDDEAEGRKSKQMQHMNFSRVNNTQSQPQTRSFSFQSSSVTYGGANGAYYTSSRTRRTGSDGLTFEESKEADTASRQATHQVFRGLHDKRSYLVLKKLGREMLESIYQAGVRDSMYMMDHMYPGDVVYFTFSVFASGLVTNGQDGPAGRGGWALPSTEQPQHSGSVRPDIGGESRAFTFLVWWETEIIKGCYMDRARKR